MRVSIVEHEAAWAALIKSNLTRQGFEAQVLTGMRHTLRELERWKPNLVLSEVMLPEIDGFDLCREIRRSATLARTPVIFLTARCDEVDRVLGLEAGGDDYITKPFSPRELVARVRAHLRRAEAGIEAETVQHGALTLDRQARRLFLDGRELALSATEFKLLEFLMTHPGRAYNRAQLLDLVWEGSRSVAPRTIDVHICRLREQIEADPGNPRYLATVRGFGYRFGDGS